MMSNFYLCHNVSTFFISLTSIYREVLYYCKDDVEVVCCRFVVCGKSLTVTEDSKKCHQTYTLDFLARKYIKRQELRRNTSIIKSVSLTEKTHATFSQCRDAF